MLLMIPDPTYRLSFEGYNGKTIMNLWGTVTAFDRARHPVSGLHWFCETTALCQPVPRNYIDGYRWDVLSYLTGKNCH